MSTANRYRMTTKPGAAQAAGIVTVIGWCNSGSVVPVSQIQPARLEEAPG